MEGAVKRPAGTIGLIISMTERQLHSQGGIEKGKLRLSRTALECGKVLTGVVPRGKESQGGEEVSAECRALQAATTAHPTRGKSFHVSARTNTQGAAKAMEKREETIAQEEGRTYHTWSKGRHQKEGKEQGSTMMTRPSAIDNPEE